MEISVSVDLAHFSRSRREIKEGLAVYDMLSVSSQLQTLSRSPSPHFQRDIVSVSEQESRS